VCLRWIEQARSQSLLVAEQQHPLTVRIQASDRIDTGREVERSQRSVGAAGFRCELRENAEGFVEEKKHRARYRTGAMESAPPDIVNA